MEVILHSPPRTATNSMQVHLQRALKEKVHRTHSVKDLIGLLPEDGGMRDCKVVSIVRDPVQRNLSQFWQFNYRHGPLNEELFVSRFLSEIDHNVQHTFIAAQLKRIWDVDVYGQDFLPPYKIYDGRVLIIRLEDLSFVNNALTELLGMDVTGAFPFQNVSPESYPRSVVKKHGWKLPKSYLDRMYATRFAIHFLYHKEHFTEFS